MTCGKRETNSARVRGLYVYAHGVILRDSRAVRRPPTQLVTPRAPLLVAFFGVLCLMPSLGRRVRADSVLMESWSDKGGLMRPLGVSVAPTYCSEDEME